MTVTEVKLFYKIYRRNDRSFNGISWKMINIVVVLLIVSLNAVLSQVVEVNESDYLVNRITDCFFVNNDVKTVELVCDNIGGNYPKDNCYSSLFVSESQEINRSKVKHLQSGQCQSKTLDKTQFEKLADKFPNVADLNLSFLGVHDVIYIGFLNTSESFSHLKVLNISHNKIGFNNWTTSLMVWGDLNVLDVSFNELKYFAGRNMSFIGNISTINLSHNSISYLGSSSFSEVRGLRVMDLRNNQIEYLGESILTMAHDTLEEIYLQNNQIKYFIHSLMFPLRALKYLNLSRNQIEDYSHVWANDFRLKLQYLDKIDHILITDYSRSGKMLKTLNFSYNRIQTFNCSFKGSMELNVLNLEGNDLTRLDAISPSNFPNLTTIAISRNRFDCEYAKRFAMQWEGITVIGDLCDQKGDEDETAYYHSILYVVIGIIACLILIAAISFWIVRYKRQSAKKQQQQQQQQSIHMKREEVVENEYT